MFCEAFKLYNSKCPKDRPPGALYLTPLTTWREDVWYFKTPLSHNALSKVVGSLMKDAGYEGHYTNHSARVTCASRLFDGEVDEQLIMARTNHASTDGVRPYKRVSTKLQELTYDVLNSSTDNGPSAKRIKCTEMIKMSLKEETKENPIPGTCISGGTNITIDNKHVSSMDYKHQSINLLFACN